MAYDVDMPGPRVVAYNLASETYNYMLRMVSLGLVEGELGSQTTPPELRALFNALHQVLAGGEVKVEVIHRGNPDIVNELNQRFDNAQKESNEVNKRSGYYFTVS